MALVASGLATAVQVRRFGPLGSGLLSVQGTSLAFLAPLIQAGHLGGLPLMLGMSLALSPVEMVLSRFLLRLRKILTPLVSGVVVLLIGISLVPVGVRGVAAGLGGGAPPWAGLAVASLVVGVVVVLHAVHRPWARISAVAVALLVGYAVCAAAGYLEYRPPTSEAWLVLPTGLSLLGSHPWRCSGGWIQQRPGRHLQLLSQYDLQPEQRCDSAHRRRLPTGRLLGRRLLVPVRLVPGD
jgi:NCS2 family nucleobase:cation symporter-2/xanthine permease XanP